MKRAIKIILFAVGLLILFYLINRVGWRKVIEVISGAKASFLFLGVLVYLAVIFTRSLKWFLLIKIIDPGITYRQLAPLYLVNSLMGNLTPFKSGEAVTPFLFRKYLKIPVGQGFSVVILDRFFELIIFIVILVLAILYILSKGIQETIVLSIFQGLLVCLFLLFVILIALIISKKIALRIVGLFAFLKKYSFFKKVFEHIAKEIDLFYGILPLFKKSKIYRAVIPLTILGWLFETLSYFLIFRSVLSISFFSMAAAQIVTAAATLVTFIPGGVGMAELGVVYILKLFGGYSIASALAGTLLVRIFLTGTLILGGLAGLLLIKKRAKLISSLEHNAGQN